MAGRIFFGTNFHPVRPVQVAGQVSKLVSFIHRRDDSFVSAEDRVLLHRASDNLEDRIWPAPGAGHVSVHRPDPFAFVRSVTGLIARHTKRGAKVKRESMR